MAGSLHNKNGHNVFFFKVILSFQPLSVCLFFQHYTLTPFPKHDWVGIMSLISRWQRPSFTFVSKMREPCWIHARNYSGQQNARYEFLTGKKKKSLNSFCSRLTLISGPLQLRLIPRSSVISVISDRSSSSNSPKLMSWVNLGKRDSRESGQIREQIQINQESTSSSNCVEQISAKS